MMPIDRRRFFKTIPAVAAVSVLGANYSAEASRPKVQSINLIPEYERHLDLLVISVEKQPRNFSDEYLSLLLSLPSYTNIVIISESDLLNEKKVLEKFRLLNRCKFITASITKYAQDIGEAIQLPNGPGLVVPTGNINRVHRPEETEYAAQLFLPSGNTLRAPFSFEGGNFTADYIDNSPHVFIGYDAILKTIKHDPDKLGSDHVISRIANFFNSKVTVLGYPKQNQRMFHIDFNFHLLPRGAAVVADFTEDYKLAPGIRDPNEHLNRHLFQEAKNQQIAVVNTLKLLGYKVLRIEHTYEDFICNRFRVNVIPFKDRNDGRHKVLIPVFENDLSDRSNTLRKQQGRYTLVPSDLKEGIRSMLKPYRDNGIVVKLVYADPWRYHNAGIHCAIQHW